MMDWSMRGMSPVQLSQMSSIDQFANVLAQRMERADTLSSGSQSMDEMFERASMATGVPVNLLKAVAKTESDFDPNCVSHAGAMGVMQLMPCNVEEYGVTDPFDPEQNIMAGAQQLADLSRRYDGDLTLTLAAYNAGSGNVAKYGGVPPFKETQNYIRKVTALVGEDITIPAAQNFMPANGMDGMLPTVTMDALLQDKMQQMIYLMAQGMKYNLPSLNLTDETTPFYL
ncbi:MAG: lytic transglycosylase domain-containing protein [Butyricicoccus pullicaecorum]|nr:lytic transglycosylase domain-containing protein [Butyricicoccus pullicaecorum]